MKSVTLQTNHSSSYNTQKVLKILKNITLPIFYLVIENRPQPALQFVAEVGGIMAFFLGISIITLIGKGHTYTS